MFLDIDMQELGPCLDEAKAGLGLQGEMAVIGIARSRVAPEERQVYGIASEQGEYVLKYDRTGPQTGRLRREFATLDWLTSRFAGTEPPIVVPPVMVGRSGNFHVTRFVDAPQARELVETAEDAETVHAVMCAAGAWLSRLHGAGPEEEGPFWPAWHFKRLDALSGDGPQANARIAAGYVARLRDDAAALRGRAVARRFSHGDLHGDNLLIGPGGAIGLDLTEARMKLAVYDVVDLLRLDMHHDFADRGVDQSGISRPAWEGFFDGYTRRLDAEVLRFCLRARALMDWLTITRDRHASSGAQRARFDRLDQRLNAAFSA